MINLSFFCRKFDQFNRAENIFKTSQVYVLSLTKVSIKKYRTEGKNLPYFNVFFCKMKNYGNNIFFVKRCKEDEFEDP